MVWERFRTTGCCNGDNGGQRARYRVGPPLLTNFEPHDGVVKLAEALRAKLIGMIDLRPVGTRNDRQAIDS